MFFNEKEENGTVNDMDGNKIKLAFLASKSVRAFPCSRRRATLNSESETANFIPFDPEAKLNTELNNRKHLGINSGIRGYVEAITDSAILRIALHGYVFDIDNYSTVADFVDSYKKCLGISDDPDELYANIIIEKTSLYKDTNLQLDYTTEILSSQKVDNDNSALDLIVNNGLDINNTENYYFSGLSFSTAPYANPAKAGETYIENTVVDTTGKILISLLVFKKGDDGCWIINNKARLPNITHGGDEDSIETGAISAKGDISAEGDVNVTGAISTGKIESKTVQLAENYRVPALNVVKDSGTGEYQLKFYYEVNN